MADESVKGKTLSYFPEILSLWDLEKNGPSISLRKRSAPPRDVLAVDVPAGCTKKVHWKCPHGPDHEWFYWIGHMTRTGKDATFKTNNCPFCSNSRASISNSVGGLYPEVSKEWHPTKNGNLKPHDVVASSSRKRWWICSNGHVTSRTPYDRCIRDRSCRRCMGEFFGLMISDFPARSDLWAEDRNEISANECSVGSNVKRWWKCPKGDDHYWKAAPFEVIRRSQGCAVCSGKQVAPSTSLAVCFPEIEKEWHPTKNGNLTPHDFTWGSGNKVWWKCSLGHEWDDSITHRTGSMNTGCPYCSGNRVSELTNITNNSPELLATWDWENNEMNPDEVSVASHRDIAWRCNDCEHRWITKPAWRRVTISNGNFRPTGCPECASSGFKSTEKAWLYLFSVLNGQKDVLFYKLGITNQDSVDVRIHQIMKSMQKVTRFANTEVMINELIPFEKGKFARELETLLLSIDNLRFHPIEKFQGSTELFISNPIQYARENGIIQKQSML